MERKTTKATILSTDEAAGVVECIFSVFGILDMGGDIVHNGAFTKTWNERAQKIKLLDSHNFDSVLSSLGKPLEFRELSRPELPEKILQDYPEATGGAWAKVQFNMKTQAGHDSFWHIAQGDIDEWSYGYDAVEKDVSKTLWRGNEVSARNLRAIKQYELSPCLWGMNPATLVVSAKSADETVDTTEEELPPEDSKAGRVYSARNLEKIRTAYNSLRQALDEAGLLEEIVDNEEEEKDNGATGPQKSDDTPTSESASEAGPPKEDSTRYLKLIEIEQEALKLLEV